MNKYVKDFLHRGLIFGGFGPLILGIIYIIIEKTTEGFALDSIQLFVAILSVYILAFLQAGATVFNQIEHWNVPKSLFCHFSVLYAAYVGCYLLNNWIPFNINVILIFTVVFAVVFFAIWLSVFIAIKITSKKLNKKI